MATTYDFYIAPSPWLLAFTAFFAFMLFGAVVTALKGRWVWFVVGLLVGVTFLVSPFLPAAPGSVWAKRAERSRRS